MVKKGESEARAALYRHYRPRSLSDVVGQSQVTEILKRSLEQGKIAHAYLLTGPRGVGKTSIARILAHDINQLPYSGEETHLDIIEIDAASNNGVDDVRDLRERVQLAPISAAKKVYIIDEVHMLSKAAFNALLKTLEEPPSHIVFILATTDLHKVPATIISRTQHFAFHSISPADVAAHLKSIAESEKIKITDDALDAIARRGEGSFRDSISLLDQLSSFADAKEGITLELVESTLGLAPRDAVRALLAAVGARDVAAVISQLDELETQGVPAAILADQLIQTVRAQLGEHPQLVGLLDALLSVPSSSQPQLKLLTVLVGAIKPKTAAAPVTLAKPLAAMVEKPLPKPHKKPIVDEKTPAPTTESPADDLLPADLTPSTPSGVTREADETVVRRSEKKPISLDWNALIEYTRENFVAVYSVLNASTHTLDGNTLTIYTGRKFNKTKLDDPKYRAKLSEALAQFGAEDVTIVTLPTAQPPADEKLAKVAELMGGGQEVKLEDS